MVEYHSRLSSLSLKYIFRNAEFSFEQLAKLCGVSRRQLRYWIEKGVVPAPDNDPLSTIERAALIRVRLEQGDTLRQAVRTVADYYEQYRNEIAKLEAMPDEERSQQLVAELEQLQEQVSRLRQALSEPSLPPFAVHALMTVLRNLALNELLTMLPHSRPTTDLIIRLQQSAGYLRLLLQDRGLGNNLKSHSS